MNLKNRDNNGNVKEPDRKSEETLYYLEYKPKKHPKQAWQGHMLCEDKEHANNLMNHPECIVNTPHGRNFHWRVVEIKTITKVSSRKVVMKSINKKEEKE